MGLRGPTRTLNWKKTSDELGHGVIDIDEFRELGIQKTVAAIRQRVGDMPAYITFDLDCLGPSVAPAVANLEPGVSGFSIDEAVGLLQGLRRLNIIGADVVCMVPSKDSPNQITALTSTAVMFEQISLIAYTLASKK